MMDIQDSQFLYNRGKTASLVGCLYFGIQMKIMAKCTRISTIVYRKLTSYEQKCDENLEKTLKIW